MDAHRSETKIFELNVFHRGPHAELKHRTTKARAAVYAVNSEVNDTQKPLESSRSLQAGLPFNSAVYIRGWQRYVAAGDWCLCWGINIHQAA